MKKILIIALALFASNLALAEMPLETVASVDPVKYLGRWYQQSRNPLPFEPLDCPCAQQTLQLRNDGLVSVFNSCNKDNPEGPLMGVLGYASIDNPGINSQLSVDFGFPKKGSYWIIGLDSQYRWAVVSDPTKSSLYILSKTPVLSNELYEDALRTAEKQLPIDKLRPTNQSGCAYPPL